MTAAALDSPPATDPEPAAPRAVPDIVRRRLATLQDTADSWVVTAVIVAIAAILRLYNLGHPNQLIFDEVYYPTDAWDMLTYGVEWDPENGGPAYVVHPPLGKWLIALGEAAFGNTPLGWRFPAAVAGTLMVLILIRVTYRLFHSLALAGAAGLLMALDGFQLVLSRTSLLDIFLGLFVLAAFAAMLLDRDHYRRRLLRRLESGQARRAVPWWLLAAGALMGLAAGVKLSALFFLPFFAVLVVVWRVQARRSAGIAGSILGDLGWGLAGTAVSVLVYLATWTGWLVTDVGYYRHHRADNGLSEPPVLGALLNLVHYHRQAFDFHSGLSKPHDYQSWPWQWLLLGRPVNFYSPQGGECGAATCMSQVLLLGTPLLWWSFLPALVALIWLAISRRDWRAWAILTGAAAGLLPWYWFAIADGRTMFSFYALPALPFLILAVVHVLGALIGPPRRQVMAVVLAAVYVALVALCFAYFWPIFVGQTIPYDDWMSRMWLGGRWI